MGKLEMPAAVPEMDFFGCPEYYISGGMTLPTGDGNTRFYAWVMKGSIAVPLYTAVAQPTRMMLIGREVTRTSEQIFNAVQMLDHRKDH